MTKLKLILMAGLVLLWGASAAMADPLHVSLNTSVLSGGTYTLGLELIDGDGVANNTAVVSDFGFNGGSAVGGASYIGDAMGDLNTSVSLDDVGGGSIFAQDFTAGTTLTFSVTLTDNLAAGAVTPDAFSFLICDTTRCYSDDASGALAMVNLDGAGSVLASDFITFGDSQSGLPAPSVTPEPSSLTLLGGGLLGLVATLRRRQGQ